MPAQPPSNNPMADFGPNEWLVDELYQQYLQDKNSVDKAWWEFFEDYRPSDGGNGSSASDGSGDGASDGNGNGSGASTSTGTGVPNSAANPEPASFKAPAASPATASKPTSPPVPAPSAPAPTAPAPTAPARSAAAPSGAAPSAPATSGAAPSAPAPSASTPAAPATSAAAPTAPARASRPAEDTDEAPKPAPKARDIPAVTPTGPLAEDEVEQLRGAAARTVTNMEASLTVPTATSVRAVPAKLLIDNRVVINNHLRRSRGGKVSFTHLIGFALIKALKLMPQMNKGFTEKEGKPALITPAHINLGLAIDMAKPDGTRTLLVPAIKATESMDFAHFWTAYEDVVRKARTNKLAVTDFQGTTISLTNPGGIGTVHSVPRLMSGQGAIIAVGALEYPAEWQGASEETLTRNAVSKIITLTSTYDHRIIQGAASGEFLRVIHQL
ncbi:MAG: multifunctional 2-oxoglutarate metabolism enzyme, partial [Actinomycetota bacterium]|nr:multifunctional 2-oxoglutarate metabolism enzyme [Actinomycetota bacterium]